MWGGGELLYFSKLAAVLRRALHPTAAPGGPVVSCVSPPPPAPGRAGTAFAVGLGEAKGCGVFLGIAIASKTLGSRGGGGSGRRVVGFWKGIRI